ncbi:MAG: phosphoribosylformylglycinamidine synthase subunit PurQ [Saprospiraceae bacterium]|jgi:phosphoribosylformylglycinamidine synthase I|nr:phosphoribosylformylglycinamidine synthase subunit PurQ [Saprospiraceae bacterium]MBP9210303.1 phosphoribosylformylglycinamidine synthase subunit PurQ [Saprospiraceae bacterium]MBV6474000.1 Phosphoribosylformylglycinamidine synthase subunit PurQ [Saprospiraceae bacterium]
MRFGVVVFPGSNCDDDMVHVLGTVFRRPVEKIWHKQDHLHGYGPGDCLILPGGFSYGDYLRCGAIARFSPIMKEVLRFANEGGLVIGICNGFQILCEAHLLPGQLLRNVGEDFICRNIHLRAASLDTPLTCRLDPNNAYMIPIAHADGRYYTDEKTLRQLQANGQIMFQYCSPEGVVGGKYNPNGSLLDIAGICNEGRNVCGLMPHPERASEAALGNEDGKYFFESLFSWISQYSMSIA